jgi:branched-chain amino acid transport system permease protein
MSAPAAIGVNIMRARILCFLGTAPVLGAAGAIITLQKLRIARASGLV